MVLVVVGVAVGSARSDERVEVDVRWCCCCLRVLAVMMHHSLRRHRIEAKDCGTVAWGVFGDECQVEGPLETGQVVLGINRSDLKSLAVSRAGA